MERILYYEARERALKPSVRPNYHRDLDMDPLQVMAERTVCVDRIFRLGVCVSAIDTTGSMAVRLFDRCMGVMCPPIARTNMMLLAIAAFDISHKVADGDFAQPTPEMYYKQALCNHCNDYTLAFEQFGQKFKEAEVAVLKAVSGEPVCPTPQDYVWECCPEWSVRGDPHGRRVSLLCSAFLYMVQSTNYTAEEIGAAAARLELGDRPHPSPEMRALCRKVDDEKAWDMALMMLEAVDKLFAVGQRSTLYFMYHDIYQSWTKK